ncbi:unnamed protein product [Nippostrongylus brasiliensis]|uniref:Protein kinase domain-containing protein n=1 Tax=Nippostrongylus brasiliensis TaxID=27835 RepID=A0A0N4YBB4_NIPBR|nr:unnamed protein product [Nippostrongylus brasiliensis]
MPHEQSEREPLTAPRIPPSPVAKCDDRSRRDATGSAYGFSSILDGARYVLRVVLASSGAPFRVKERYTGHEFLAQLKPIDDALQRNVDMYNSLDHENIVRFHEVIKDDKLAMVVYEK